jgi:two-component system, sensor histidine kinase
MGGEVGVESRLGHGARFWFTLRCQRGVSSEPINAPQHAAIDSVEPLHGRILVVDDNAINCKVVAATLRRLGLEVEIATQGQEGVRIAMEMRGNIDLVLMDLQMPIVDGYAATQMIRSWEDDNAVQRLPIIALTADAFEEDRQRALAVGMDDFLTKPINMARLEEALRRWLPRKGSST